jgi:hypothetical protein
MKFIDDWKQSYKLKSIQTNAIWAFFYVLVFAVLQLLQLASVYFPDFWASLPNEIKELLPHSWIIWIGVANNLFGIYARLKAQPELHSNPLGLASTLPVSKKLTDTQIKTQAMLLGVEVAALKAVIAVECRGLGFNADDTPVILFERHVFYLRLRSIGWLTKSKEWANLYPEICNPIAGGYGKFSEQHAKLSKASKLNRDVALESCSWGIGQVMGYHWKALGYASLQAFINAMYKDEASQLEAMCRYIKTNNLANALKRKDWKAFAKGYNGIAYAKNQYDVKLENAYKKALN